MINFHSKRTLSHLSFSFWFVITVSVCIYIVRFLLFAITKLIAGQGPCLAELPQACHPPFFLLLPLLLLPLLLNLDLDCCYCLPVASPFEWASPTLCSALGNNTVELSSSFCCIGDISGQILDISSFLWMVPHLPQSLCTVFLFWLKKYLFCGRCK